MLKPGIEFHTMTLMISINRLGYRSQCFELSIRGSLPELVIVDDLKALAQKLDQVGMAHGGSLDV